MATLASRAAVVVPGVADILWIEQGGTSHKITYANLEAAIAAAAVADAQVAILLSDAGVPAVTPDFIGQTYVDTTTEISYIATGTGSSADWNQVLSQDSNGNYIIRDGDELRFYDVGNSHYVGFESPALIANQIYVLPTADGSADDVLKTDGSGNLAWVTPYKYTYAFEGDTATSSGVEIATASGSGTTIKIMKAVQAQMFHDFSGAATHSSELLVLQNGTHRRIKLESGTSDAWYPISLNPGTYRIIDTHAGGSGSGTTKLIAYGVAGGELTTASILE